MIWDLFFFTLLIHQKVSIGGEIVNICHHEQTVTKKE